jgi:hypothetical protein
MHSSRINDLDIIFKKNISVTQRNKTTEISTISNQIKELLFMNAERTY